MPTTEIRRLIREMNSLYQGSPWYGNSMKKVFQGINADKAFNRPVPDAHCIAELLCHIIAWRDLLNRRLQGDSLFSVRQKDSFDWSRWDPVPAKAWNKLLKAMETNQRQIIAGLEKADDALLTQRVAGRRYTFARLIRGTLQHDLYYEL